MVRYLSGFAADDMDDIRKSGPPLQETLQPVYLGEKLPVSPKITGIGVKTEGPYHYCILNVCTYNYMYYIVLYHIISGEGVSVSGSSRMPTLNPQN